MKHYTLVNKSNVAAALGFVLLSAVSSSGFALSESYTGAGNNQNNQDTDAFGQCSLSFGPAAGALTNCGNIRVKQSDCKGLRGHNYSNFRFDTTFQPEAADAAAAPKSR